MSRLDYITVAIVAACILAIIFLVYKMTNLFDGDSTTDPIEAPTNPVEVEDSTYVGALDTLVTDDGSASTDIETPANPGSTTSTGETGSTTADTDEEEVKDTPRPAEQPSTKTYSQGKFMVIAGTFSKSALAKAQVSKLKSLGFNNARIEPFDRGKFDVVLVDRFDNMAAAERLVKSLKGKGVECYVKTKEAQ